MTMQSQTACIISLITHMEIRVVNPWDIIYV